MSKKETVDENQMDIFDILYPERKKPKEQKGVRT